MNTTSIQNKYIQEEHSTRRSVILDYTRCILLGFWSQILYTDYVIRMGNSEESVNPLSSVIVEKLMYSFILFAVLTMNSFEETHLHI